MTFPVHDVDSFVSNSYTGSATTSRAINMPTGYAVGDLILCIVGGSTPPSASTSDEVRIVSGSSSSGWQFVDDYTGAAITSTTSAGWTSVGIWKIADSLSESLTIEYYDVSLSAADSVDGWTQCAILISGAAGIEGLNQSVNTGGSEQVSPAYTVSGSGEFVGAKDYLWIAVIGNASALTLANVTEPSGYSDKLGISGTTSTASFCMAFKQANASSESAATWTNTSTTCAYNAMFVVAPDAGASGVVPQARNYYAQQ